MLFLQKILNEFAVKESSRKARENFIVLNEGCRFKART